MKRDIREREITEILNILTENNVGNLQQANILEIGCGDGRLSYQLLTHVNSLQAIDPSEEDIAKAKSSLNGRENISFQVADAQKLPFDDNSFEFVIFSLSLCCMGELKNMQSALREAYRVLKPDGYVLNLQPSMKIHFLSGFQWYLITKQMDKLTKLSSQESRFALKLAVFEEKMFTYLDECDFDTKWFQDDKETALKYWVEDDQDEYDKLDGETKKRIEDYVDQFVTDEGVVYPVAECLTLLRKLDKH